MCFVKLINTEEIWDQHLEFGQQRDVPQKVQKKGMYNFFPRADTLPGFQEALAEYGCLLNFLVLKLAHRSF